MGRQRVGKLRVGFRRVSVVVGSGDRVVVRDVVVECVGIGLERKPRLRAEIGRAGWVHRAGGAARTLTHAIARDRKRRSHRLERLSLRGSAEQEPEGDDEGGEGDVHEGAATRMRIR
jgi:hypothetical protein